MINGQKDLTALTQEQLQLGIQLAEFSKGQDPAQPAKYEAAREAWSTTYKQFSENVAAMRSRMTLRQRAQLATAFAEILRPLFERWACDTTCERYQRIMASLWGRRVENKSLLAEIAASPEFECDDSNQRDHSVGAALSIVETVLAVLNAYAEGDAALNLPAELDEQIQDFANGMEEAVSGIAFSRVPTQLRELVFQVAEHLDDDVAAVDLQTSTERIAKAIDSGLDCVARDNGWPLDRVSNTTCCFTEVQSVQAEVVEIDWDA